MELNVYQVYGSRDDTDAVVVRLMERRVSEAEQSAYHANNQVRAMREAIASAGFRFVDREYGKPARLEKVEK